MSKQARTNFNPELAAWLNQQGIALAPSTCRANRLIFLGVDAKRALQIHERHYDRPMGLFAKCQSLWMAGRPISGVSKTCSLPVSTMTALTVFTSLPQAFSPVRSMPMSWW